MTLRIAAVGYGDIAQRRHFPQLVELAGRAELVAIAGRDAGRMADCAARFGVPRWSADVACVIGDPGVDAVLVLTAATVFMTSIAIFLFGGGLIRDFAFALCIGVVVGSFSSIFVANPIFMALHNRFEARKAELERSKAAGGTAGGEAAAGV